MKSKSKEVDLPAPPPGPPNEEGLIVQNVLKILGRPKDLQRVQVKLLWENCYRVNIFVGADLLDAKIANSYFLQCDGEGKIVVSTPKLLKMYGTN